MGNFFGITTMRTFILRKIVFYIKGCLPHHRLLLTGWTPSRVIFKFTKASLFSQAVFSSFFMNHNNPPENIWQANKKQQQNKGVCQKSVFYQNHNDVLNHKFRTFLLLFRKNIIKETRRDCKAFLLPCPQEAQL